MKFIMTISKRYLLLIIIIIIFSTTGTIRLVNTTASNSSDLSGYLKRFEVVKKYLKNFKIKTVGYVTKKIDVRTFYLTQYAVAPTMVINDSNLELVIGNFRESSHFFRKFRKRKNYKIIWNFGNGVLLLKRKLG